MTAFTRIVMSTYDQNVVTPGIVELATFSVQPYSDAHTPFLVKAVVGLDADELIPSFAGMSTRVAGKTARDTLTYPRQQMKMNKREVVIRAVMNPNHVVGESFSDLRRQIYRAISATPRGEVNLTFYLGGSPLGVLTGRIIKMEAPYFSETPELQVTIECADPLFRSSNTVALLPTELPTEDDFTVTDQTSSAAHGLQFCFTFLQARASLIIQNSYVDPAWTFVASPTGGFVAGDVVYLGTDANDRYLYKIQDTEYGTTTTHILNSITKPSVWPVLFPGSNPFNIPGIESGQIRVDLLEYKHAHWGI